ncbi:MAG: BrnT family toxin [Nostoc sp.]|uniref:BrnT family toxin n=1 Tax=Nostoc sp. TaxID=1180 RepID=UPI002FF539AC
MRSHQVIRHFELVISHFACGKHRNELVKEHFELVIRHFELVIRHFACGKHRNELVKEHSLEEDRYIILGMSDSLRLLLVCHLYQESEEVIRIISARKATKPERQQYQSFFS